jgi:GxxExxY protein
MKPQTKYNDVDPDKVVHKELSYKIVQACYEVHNVLGPGYSEKIYEEAMERELTGQGVSVDRQRIVAVMYKGENIGEYRLDSVADEKVLLEFKAVSELNSIFESQVLSYLKASGLKLGLLINFGGKKVEVRRIVN